MMTNVLCFGDSITYGEYDGILGGWVDSLKRYCHTKYYTEGAKEVNVINLGIGGETTDGLLKRLPIELAARTSPDENLVFFFYGANDLAIKNGVPLVDKRTFESNIRSAVKSAKNVTAQIALISIIPISDQIDGVATASGKLRTNEAVNEYNKIIKAAADGTNIQYIDVHTTFSKNKEELLSKDHVHPNEKGYELIAELIKPFVDVKL